MYRYFLILILFSSNAFSTKYGIDDPKLQLGILGSAYFHQLGDPQHKFTSDGCELLKEQNAGISLLLIGVRFNEIFGLEIGNDFHNSKKGILDHNGTKHDIRLYNHYLDLATYHKIAPMLYVHGGVGVGLTYVTGAKNYLKISERSSRAGPRITLGLQMNFDEVSALRVGYVWQVAHSSRLYKRADAFKMGLIYLV